MNPHLLQKNTPMIAAIIKMTKAAKTPPTAPPVTANGQIQKDDKDQSQVMQNPGIYA